MQYYKIILDNMIVGCGTTWLKWHERQYYYCNLDDAEIAQDNVTGTYYTADWLRNPPAEATPAIVAEISLINATEYDEIYEQLSGGEEIPVPDPEPEPEPEPTPEPEPEPVVVQRATRYIAEGEYFYLNKKLCKAKTSIANGAILTLNTNYQITTIENELSLLNQ